jgi:predicted DNA-binding transcriptional regulator YafY
MSFKKAVKLLELAVMASRHSGVRRSDIEDRFQVCRRTAQRMAFALVEAFPETETSTDFDQRKVWRLRTRAVRELGGLGPSDLAALQTAAAQLQRTGDATTAAAIRKVHDKVLAQMPDRDARRADTDADAILEQLGVAARPGPRAPVDPAVVQAIEDALTGPFRMEITYAAKRDVAPSVRIVEPHGVLLGARRYLIARRWQDGIAQHRKYRIDRITHAKVLQDSFVPEDGFDITALANRSFGVWLDEEQYGEVVWRFAPRAAEHARSFQFHPEQVFEDQPDGSLIVRFHAAGWLEMAWHLYQWGDAVEVLAPRELAEMVNPYRRSDLGDALP